jgi:hypothetical protein
MRGTCNACFKLCLPIADLQDQTNVDASPFVVKSNECKVSRFEICMRIKKKIITNKKKKKKNWNK